MWKLLLFQRINWNYTKLLSFQKCFNCVSFCILKNDYTSTWIIIECYRKHRLCLFEIFNFLLIKVDANSKFSSVKCMQIANILIYQLKKKDILKWSFIFLRFSPAHLITLILYWWTYHFWWCIRLFLCNVYLDDWKNKSRSNK